MVMGNKTKAFSMLELALDLLRQTLELALDSCKFEELITFVV